MRVTGLLIDLQKRFPKSPIEAWEQTYFDTLRRFEGEPLDTAYRDTMSDWTESYPPRPAHIAAAVKIEKPETDDKRLPCEKRDDSRIARARALKETAERECAAACQEAWGGYAKVHLAQAAYFVARMEIAGMSIGDALAKFNAHDPRPGFPNRNPELWLDEHDYTIFARRFESQKRLSEKFHKLKPLQG